MSTVGAVGKPPEQKPAQPGEKPAHPAQPEQPKQPEKKTPKQEFQAIINEWASMLPVAFVNRLEDFASKNIK